MTLPSPAAAAACMVFSSVKGYVSHGLIGVLTGPLNLTTILALVDLLLHVVLQNFPEQEAKLLELAAAKESQCQGFNAGKQDYEALGSARPEHASCRSGLEFLAGASFAQLVAVCLRFKLREYGNFWTICGTPYHAMMFLVFGYGFSKIFHALIRRYTKLSLLPWFWFVLILYAGVTLFVGIVPALVGGDPTAQHIESDNDLALVGGSRYDDTYLTPGLEHGEGSYPVCTWRSPGKSSPHGTLSVLDLAVFAQAVYFSEEHDVLRVVQEAVQDTDLGEAHVERLDDVNRVGRLGIFALPKAKTRVIAIRGSTTEADWRFNLDIWMPAVMFTVVQQVVPFGELLPNGFGSFVANLDLRDMFGFQEPWIGLCDEVAAVLKKSKQQGYDTIITGHSLGGGLAQVLGAYHHVPTVGFSPVGMTYTQGRVGLNSENHAVEKSVLSILPAWDLVPNLDRQSGVQQPIRCTSWNPGACHSIVRTFCEIYHSCGDPRGRTMGGRCQKLLGEGWNSYREVDLPEMTEQGEVNDTWFNFI